MPLPDNVLSGLLGAIAALLLTPIVQRFFAVRREKVALIAEMRDVIRHLVANEDVLNRFVTGRQGNRRPLAVHLAKLSVPEDFLLFSKETFRLMPSRVAPELNRMKLRLRNYNLVVAELMRLHGQVDAPFWEFADYAARESARVAKGLDESLAGTFRVFDIHIAGMRRAIQASQRDLFWTDLDKQPQAANGLQQPAGTSA